MYYMISINNFIGAGFDFTCFLNVPLLNPGGNNGAYVGGYKSDSAKGAIVDFSRTVDLNTGNGLDLPTDSYQRTHPDKNVEAKQLMMPATGGKERIGAFNCNAEKNGEVHNITIIVLNAYGR